jgi:hypothetical protein
MPLFFPLGFLAFFAAMWCGVSYMVARISGWTALAARYRALDEPTGERLLWTSAQLGGASFRSCLNLTLSASGLSMVPSLLFRLFMKPLLIPWSDARFEGFSKILFLEFACFSLGGEGGTVYCTYRKTADRLLPFLSEKDRRDYAAGKRYERGAIDSRIAKIAVGAALFAAALGVVSALLAGNR